MQIYDFNDDNSFDFIDYDPYLSSPNIAAPISPPAAVQKNNSSGNLILSWNANSESDLSEYKIHYGNHTGYSFANTIMLEM